MKNMTWERLQPASCKNMIPPRFYEPLPSGPKKGQATDRAKVEESRKKCYKAMGWDERGIPKSDVLAQLGLECP